jgi:hypothetical protein
MPMPTSEVVLACALFYLIVILVDWVRSRRLKRFLLELSSLLILLIISLLIANSSVGFVSFGPAHSPTIVVLIMLGSILLGIAARYIFYLKGEFSWLDFAKPLCISPVLLLPLMGSVQAVKDLEAMQVVSFALLAFQNGFFWQAVLERAKPLE